MGVQRDLNFIFDEKILENIPRSNSPRYSFLHASVLLCLSLGAQSELFSNLCKLSLLCLLLMSFEACNIVRSTDRFTYTSSHQYHLPQNHKQPSTYLSLTSLLPQLISQRMNMIVHFFAARNHQLINTFLPLIPLAILTLSSHLVQTLQNHIAQTDLEFVFQG